MLFIFQGRLCPLARALAGLACLAPVTIHAQQLAANTQAVPSLAPVTVTATLREEDPRTAPASVTVIDREELEKRNPTDLLDAVRGEPGVTLSPRQVGGRKTISLRGMEGKHVLTLIDGRRISPTDDVVGHSDYQYGWVPMSAIERIEIIRGPMSTLYGSEALGGVVNLITREPTDHWEGEASLTGSTNLGGESATGGSAAVYAAGMVGERIGLRINAAHAETPDVADADDSRYSEIEGSKIDTAGLGLSFKINANNTLRADYQQGREKRHYDDVARSGAEYKNRYTLVRKHGGVSWHADYDRWQGVLRAYGSSIDITNSRSNGQSATRPQYLEDKVLDGHVSTTLGLHTLTAGGEMRRETLENDGLIGGKDHADHKAIFLQDEIALTQSLTLTGGVRYDHHSQFGTEYSPRAYLVWEAGNGLVIKGGYGHAFKAPTLKQVSPNYVGAEGPHTFMGNGDIKPESMDSFELSADWAFDNLDLRAGIFHSEVRDLITYRLLQQIGPRRIYQYDNVDKARISGIEAGYSWSFAPGWSWATDITALRTRDRSTGDELSYRPKLSLTSRLDWTGPNGWSARLGLERVGSQHADDSRLPGYNLWNASVSKAFGERYTVQLAFENIGNVRLADVSQDFGYAERGRMVSLNLRARF
jgi:outer membrane receptor for ferrienterochelin and colicins